MMNNLALVLVLTTEERSCWSPPVKMFSDMTVRELKRCEPRHQCFVCGYVASCKSSLVIHSRSHTGEKPFSFKLCNQNFSQKCSLTMHLLTHKDIRRFQCSECNYKATTKKHLEVHLLQHSGAKPHQCDVCDYSTSSTKGHLTAHKQTHSEDKPYSCTLCTYKAKQSASLNNHMKKHTGYPFVCSECDYQTPMKGNLDRHMLTHTGQKPFACPYCTYRARLKGHITQHTNICKHGGGGPTSFLYMATRFLPNVHVQNVQKCTKMYKIGFFMFGSSLDRFTCCG